jgi:toxin-antitoxin system PIN domain toxin
MLCPDVNVLIYAHRTDSPEHVAYARWLTQVATGVEPFAMSELCMVGFVRIVTNPRAFRQPTSPQRALDFLERITARSHCRRVRPGDNHFEIFQALVRETGATGPFVADLQHAAVAIEHGLEWVTNDGDFARVPGLRTRHPLRP